MSLKVISWNLKYNGKQSKSWELIRRYNPDICCLQEVSSIPEFIYKSFTVIKEIPSYKDLNKQKFSSVILHKGKTIEKTNLTFSNSSIEKIYKSFTGNMFCYKIDLNKKSYYVYNVYSPPWKIPTKLYRKRDVVEIKLKKNPDLWLTEIILDSLKNTLKGSDNIFVCGDLNSSITFDFGNNGDRGNQEIQSKFHKLGLYDTLSDFNGGYIPTFRHSRGSVKHQLDYIYVNLKLLDTLQDSTTLDRKKIFEEQISDHLPICSVFR